MTRVTDEGHAVDVINIDFAEAFDSVNHRFLLAKMKSFGRSGGLKHTLLDGSREYTSVESTRRPFQCAAVFRKTP